MPKAAQPASAPPPDAGSAFTPSPRSASKAGWTDEVEAMDSPNPSFTGSGHHPRRKGSFVHAGPQFKNVQSPDLEEKAAEYERRINVLTFCLEEQVMENNRLQKNIEMLEKKLSFYGKGRGGVDEAKFADNLHLMEKIKTLENEIKERDNRLEEWQENYNKIKEEEEEVKREYEDSKKLVAVLRGQLDDSRKVEEKLTSGGETGGKDKNWEERYKQERRDKKRLEDLVYSYEETIEKLKQSVKAKEKKYRQFVSKFDKEKEKKQALMESNEEYELRLQVMEKDLMDALHKEGERRMEAEYWRDDMKKKLKKLKKRLKKHEKKKSDDVSGKEEEEEDEGNDEEGNGVEVSEDSEEEEKEE